MNILEDKGSNLFKSVLSSLRKDKKWYIIYFSNIFNLSDSKKYLKPILLIYASLWL